MIPEHYVMPDAPLGPGETCFRVLVGGGAGFEMCHSLRFSDITNGTSNTIMVVEAADGVPWTKPEEIMYAPDGPLPPFGIFKDAPYFQAAFFDGTVHLLPKTISDKELRKMIRRSDR